MPSTRGKPCAQPGCPAVIDRRRRWCDDHQRDEWRRVNAAKDPAVLALYKSARWRREKAEQLRLHPLCQCDDCQEGAILVTGADTVDHDPPHDGTAETFFDRARYRSMAKPHHDKKTAARDGGFGNPKRP